MSGGFFRGTSADQDTRFSNKQAKLMKSQKFAPELDHLVDMTKVKMDVMRPWIANRVTELLGFEDEVLINFIYGLLDGKEINGKEVQISLTGFMEKNTGKFMKELWTLLISAQKNASGVPQQFLDAKEEETRKKKAETDRITNEIEKKKEKENRDIEEEKMRKRDGVSDGSRANNAALEPSSKHQLRASSGHSADEKETSERNGSRGRTRVSRSPHSADCSLSPRKTRSRSISKSFSNSRSYSGERHKSRSVSESPNPRRRSVSSERVYHSPPRRSITPRRRYSPLRSLSPSRRRSSRSRRRSTSRSRRRSRSPIRRRLRSPVRRRSPSPIRRRSRSRSPLHHRSRSPVRYRSRSPVRRRTPPPGRHRSPSPGRRRLPYLGRRRSPSPVRRQYRRSPSTPRRRSPSPLRRRSPPNRRGLQISSRHRSPSLEERSSPSPVRRLSPLPRRRNSPKPQARSPLQSTREQLRSSEKFSRARPREIVENYSDIHKSPDSVVRRPPISLRSPQRDPRDRGNTRKKTASSSPSPKRFQSNSESPPSSRRRGPSEERRSYSPDGSPVKQTKEREIRDISDSPPRKPRDQKPFHAESGQNEENKYARDNGDQKLKSSENAHLSTADKRKDPLEGLHGRHGSEIRSRSDGLELGKKDQEMRSEKLPRRVHPEVSDEQQLPTNHMKSSLIERQRVSYLEEAVQADEMVKESKQLPETETASRLAGKVDEKTRGGSFSSGSLGSDKRLPGAHGRRKHKRSERKEVESDDSDDSEIEDRKEAKKRRKEEKRSRREDRRRRREDRRRRRREDRRAEKLKAKSMDTATPSSDHEINRDGNASDGERFVRMESGASKAEDAGSEQKKLENELRMKALEAIRAKKGVSQ